jgi:hypothetical protein
MRDTEIGAGFSCGRRTGPDFTADHLVHAMNETLINVPVSCILGPEKTF